MLKSIEIGRKTFVIKFSRTHRGLSCYGLCRFVPVGVGTFRSVPVATGRCRLVQVPTGAGADRNCGEIAVV